LAFHDGVLRNLGYVWGMSQVYAPRFLREFHWDDGRY
jgi:hypothetical protein